MAHSLLHDSSVEDLLQGYLINQSVPHDIPPSTFDEVLDDSTPVDVSYYQYPMYPVALDEDLLSELALHECKCHSFHVLLVLGFISYRAIDTSPSPALLHDTIQSSSASNTWVEGLQGMCLLFAVSRCIDHLLHFQDTTYQTSWMAKIPCISPRLIPFCWSPIIINFPRCRLPMNNLFRGHLCLISRLFSNNLSVFTLLCLSRQEPFSMSPARYSLPALKRQRWNARLNKSVPNFCVPNYSFWKPTLTNVSISSFFCRSRYLAILCIPTIFMCNLYVIAFAICPSFPGFVLFSALHRLALSTAFPLSITCITHYLCCHLHRFHIVPLAMF
jgi:hypothetical protein